MEAIGLLDTLPVVSYVLDTLYTVYIAIDTVKELRVVKTPVNRAKPAPGI
jgi:hypothetical protein